MVHYVNYQDQFEEIKAKQVKNFLTKTVQESKDAAEESKKDNLGALLTNNAEMIEEPKELTKQ